MAGSAGAGNVVGVGQTGVQIQLPNGGDVQDIQALPQCANLADDDGDGATDLSDPDCSGPLDSSEAGTTGTTSPPTTTTPDETTTTTPETTTPAETTTTTPDETTTTTPDEGGTVSGPGGSGGRGIGEVKPNGPRKPGSRDHKPNKPDRGGHDGGTRADPEAITEQPDRRPDGTPTDTNPGLTDRRLRPRADRRPELRHRPVHDPALPAADLPGLRDPVRDPVAGARLDQPDRDRVRHQPQRLHRRRPRLDAVHALDLGGLRGRRQRRRPQGPLQPGRRDLRRGPLPAAPPAARTTSARRSSPTTTPTGTSTRSCSTRTSTASSPTTWSARSPGLTEGAHFPVAADARYADDISEREALRALEARQGRRRQRRRRDLRLTHTSRHQHLLAARALRSSRSTTA